MAQDDSRVHEQVGLDAARFEDVLESLEDCVIAVVDRDDDVRLALDPARDRVVKAHEFVTHRRHAVELIGELLLRVVQVGLAAPEKGMVVEDYDGAFRNGGSDERQRACQDERGQS